MEIKYLNNEQYKLYEKKLVNKYNKQGKYNRIIMTDPCKIEIKDTK